MNYIKLIQFLLFIVICTNFQAVLEAHDKINPTTERWVIDAGKKGEVSSELKEKLYELLKGKIEIKVQEKNAIFQRRNTTLEGRGFEDIPTPTSKEEWTAIQTFPFKLITVVIPESTVVPDNLREKIDKDTKLKLNIVHGLDDLEIIKLKDYFSSPDDSDKQEDPKPSSIWEDFPWEKMGVFLFLVFLAVLGLGIAPFFYSYHKFLNRNQLWLDSKLSDLKKALQANLNKESKADPLSGGGVALSVDDIDQKKSSENSENSSIGSRYDVFNRLEINQLKELFKEVKHEIRVAILAQLKAEKRQLFLESLEDNNERIEYIIELAKLDEIDSTKVQSINEAIQKIDTLGFTVNGARKAGEVLSVMETFQKPILTKLENSSDPKLEDLKSYIVSLDQIINRKFDIVAFEKLKKHIPRIFDIVKRHINNPIRLSERLFFSVIEEELNNKLTPKEKNIISYCLRNSSWDSVLKIINIYHLTNILLKNNRSSFEELMQIYDKRTKKVLLYQNKNNPPSKNELKINQLTIVEALGSTKKRQWPEIERLLKNP